MFRDTSKDGAPGEQPAIGETTLQEAWQRVLRRLRAELGEDVFSSWFSRVEFAGLSAGTAQITVPTRFLKSWLMQHYADRICGHFSSEVSAVAAITIAVRSVLPRQTMARIQQAQASDTARRAEPAAPRSEDRPVAPPAMTAGALDANGQIGNALDRRLTFASFVVGRSNAMARAAGEKVATSTVTVDHYNPLYIHAGVGLGKTHLLQAIGHAAAEHGRRAIYLSAEGFMYGFVASLKQQSALAFKERLRNIDLLIIDDVQFLQGKAVQQEFCHTLNALFDAGRAVVVAADRPPGELESLDERVRSRLKGGLTVEIEPLDEDLRMRILEQRIACAKLANPGFEVPAGVVQYVAQAIATNGRDLDGAVNRLLAHVTLSGASLTLETAEVAIRDLVRTREPKRVKIEDIQKLVATHFNVSRADILSARRTANVVRPRQVAMYLSKTLTLRSLPEIGRRFGGRDHTTVLHAVRKIEGMLGQDLPLRETVELLRRMLMD